MNILILDHFTRFFEKHKNFLATTELIVDCNTLSSFSDIKIRLFLTFISILIFQVHGFIFYRLKTSIILTEKGISNECCKN